MGYKEYQDFIDFTIILKNYYGVEKNKELSQGAFVRKLFENICDADIDTCISGNEDTLSRYLRDRSIYGKSANKKLLASVNKRKFEKWIHNKNMAAASLELLLRNIKVFVNNHPARFEKENKKELLALCKIETAGKFVVEILVNILSMSDKDAYKQNKKSPTAFWQVSEEANQPNFISDFKSAQIETLTNTATIIEQTKVTSTIATGVNDANVKLDKIIETIPEISNLNSFLNAQASTAMNTFVYSLIGGNITKYSQSEYEQLSKLIKDEINFQLIKAILLRLPDDVADEIERLTDVISPEALDKLAQKRIKEYKLDVNTILFETMARFTELYIKTADSTKGVFTYDTLEEMYPELFIETENDGIELNPKAAAYNEALKKYGDAELHKRFANETNNASGLMTNPQDLTDEILNEFVDVLIGEHAEEMTSSELNEMRFQILDEVDEAINNAIMDSLPDEAKIAIEEALNSGDIPTYSIVLFQQLIKYKVDTISVMSDIFIRFLEIYNPSLSGFGIFENELEAAAAVQVGEQCFTHYEDVSGKTNVELEKILADYAADMLAKSESLEKMQIGTFLKIKHYCSALNMLLDYRDFDYDPIIIEKSPYTYLMWLLTEIIKRFETECKNIKNEFQNSMFQKEIKPLCYSKVEEIINNCPDLKIAEELLNDWS